MEKITKNYKVAANGLLTIENGNIYISIEDGIQNVNLSDLLQDFSDKIVKLSVAYDEDYGIEFDENTGEIIE